MPFRVLKAQYIQVLVDHQNRQRLFLEPEFFRGRDNSKSLKAFAARFARKAVGEEAIAISEKF